MNQKTHPLISAHRGGRLEAPENTLDAFQRAVDLGFDGAECDVRLSADGVPVVIHDATVDRTTNGSGEVHTFTADQLAGLDARAGFDDWPDKPGVPRFADVMQVAKNLGYFEIEIKADAPARIDALVPRLIEEVDRAGARNLVRFISFDPEILRKCHDQAPDIAMSLITLMSDLDAIQRALDLGCTGVAFDIKTLSQQAVNDAHDENLWVTCWTVDTIDDFASVNDWGAEVVTTDNPSHMRTLREQRQPSH